jgi:hypothetical protein
MDQKKGMNFDFDFKMLNNFLVTFILSKLKLPMEVNIKLKLLLLQRMICVASTVKGILNSILCLGTVKDSSQLSTKYDKYCGCCSLHSDTEFEQKIVKEMAKQGHSLDEYITRFNSTRILDLLYNVLNSILSLSQNTIQSKKLLTDQNTSEIITKILIKILNVDNFNSIQRKTLFMVIRVNCQILSVLETTVSSSNQEQSKKSIELLLKFLYWSVASVHECSIELPRRYQLTSPKFIQSVLNIVYLKIKLNRCLNEDLLESRVLESLFAIIGLIQVHDYCVLHPKQESIQHLTLTCLKILLQMLSLDNSKPFLENIPKKLIEPIGHLIGSSINEYFYQKKDQLEIKIVLQLFLVLTMSKNALTPLGDSNLLMNLVHSEYCETILNGDEFYSLLLLSCIENISMDSAIRFKLRNIGGQSTIIIPISHCMIPDVVDTMIPNEPKGVMHPEVVGASTTLNQESLYVTPGGLWDFEMNLISICIEGLLIKVARFEFFEKVLERSLTFLNQYFGHESGLLLLFYSNVKIYKSQSGSMDVITIQHRPADNLVEGLLLLLEDSLQNLLLLDITAEENAISHQTQESICHILDSIYRTEKSRDILVRSTKLSNICKIMLEIDNETAQNILKKITMRLFFDPFFGLRLVENDAYMILFDLLLHDSNLEILQEFETRFEMKLEEILPSILLLFEFTFRDNVANESIHQKLQCSISIGYICPALLIQSVLTKNYTNRLLSSAVGYKIWNVLLSDPENKNLQNVLKYLSSKVKSYKPLNVMNVKQKSRSTCFLQLLISSEVEQNLLYLKKRKRDGLVTFNFPNDPKKRDIFFAKELLIASSPVFSTMLSGEYMESFSEVITIHDCKISDFICILIYILEFPNSKLKDCYFEDGRLLDHVSKLFRLITIGGRYLIPGFQVHCVIWIKEAIDYSIEYGDFEASYGIYGFLNEYKEEVGDDFNRLVNHSIKACVSNLK